MSFASAMLDRSGVDLLDTTFVLAREGSVQSALYRSCADANKEREGGLLRS